MRFVVLFLVACVGPRWNASSLLLDADQAVARALGEDAVSSFDPKLMPTIPAPVSLRPCCAFGMDLTMRYIGVPIYYLPNVIGVADMGRHEYDHGMVALQSNGDFIGLERNALLYTCRGGFIDTAHVRDNADMVFYLATQLLASYPQLDLRFTTNDANVHVQITAPPGGDRFVVAATIAEWLGYQHGTWHEVAQWFGYQSVRGYSEQVSAFSPEDFYSNALGVTLGGLAARQRVFRSREDYNAGIDAWLFASLKLLRSLPKEQARSVMQSVDGNWWDSRFSLPDNRTVPKRSFEVYGELHPWRTTHALCGNTTERTLRVNSVLGGRQIGEFANIEWSPNGWGAPDFPSLVRAADLPGLIERAQREMRASFKEGFDRP